MKAGKTVVATFGEAEKAEAVKTRLEQAGIPAVVGDESKLQKFIYLSRPLASQKVYVNDEDCEKARQFLKEAHAQDHILDGEVRCPDCGSPRVEYPQFTRKFLMTTLVELACWLRLVEKRFYCMDCHFTWPVAVRLRKKSDILNWPLKKGGPVKREGF
jgi:transposase-like protein